MKNLILAMSMLYITSSHAQFTGKKYDIEVDHSRTFRHGKKHARVARKVMTAEYAAYRNAENERARLANIEKEKQDSLDKEFVLSFGFELSRFDRYVKLSNVEISIDHNKLAANLRNDRKYLDKANTDAAKLIALNSTLYANSSRLHEFLMLYNVQRWNMKTADINAWRELTIKSRKAFIAIRKANIDFSEKYGYTSILKDPHQQNYQAFVDNLELSEYILGL